MPPGEPGHPLRRLLANPLFLRLWGVGALANAMRWLEILVSAVFVYQVTQSALAVSLVSMMRALPMLLAGALTGALAEVLDRRHLLMLGQTISAVTAGTVSVLALLGVLQVWHMALAGFCGGLVWTSEMASRRRMLTEAAGQRDVVQAVALDSTTNATTRMVGPLLGGLIYGSLGMAAAYGLSCALYLAALLLLSGVRHRQETGRFSPRQVLADMAEGLRVVRRHPALLTVILVTIAMNIFGFCFNAVLPALGQAQFAATPFQVGLLTASEPAGGLLAGLFMASRRGAPLSPGLMVAGSAFFLCCLIGMTLAGQLWLAVALLVLGGTGTALFGALQTALPVTQAPPEARSRVLGLVTTCIGMSPFGTLAIGVLADALGPGKAILIMAGLGLAVLAGTALFVLRPVERRRALADPAAGTKE